MIINFIQTYIYFIIPISVAVCIQLCKLIIDRFDGRKQINWTQLFTAGGFPSVHSGLSASLVTIIALEAGFDSPVFAVALCFALLFWYDAANIRFQAGQHAQYLNHIYRLVRQLKKIWVDHHELHHLKERLGHTVTEVIGWIVFAIILTYLLHFLLYFM
jgi:acid phosphatase family membrane protein YuiD